MPCNTSRSTSILSLIIRFQTLSHLELYTPLQKIHLRSHQSVFVPFRQILNLRSVQYHPIYTNALYISFFTLLVTFPFTETEFNARVIFLLLLTPSATLPLIFPNLLNHTPKILSSFHSYYSFSKRLNPSPIIASPIVDRIFSLFQTPISHFY